jgi:hypothetical protein
MVIGIWYMLHIKSNSHIERDLPVVDEELRLMSAIIARVTINTHDVVRRHRRCKRT